MVVVVVVGGDVFVALLSNFAPFSLMMLLWLFLRLFV